MAVYFAKNALLPQGWADNVLISTDKSGWITDVQPNQSASGAVNLGDTILPGMPNLHSHAFQRAMAGLAERATGEKDSFWTWRDVMYKFLEKLTPDDQGAIAAQLYVEMLKSGYTSVGEFHYVHHKPDGSPYDDTAITSRHIIEAAKGTGIAITHLPVLYAHGGFGAKPPTEGQKRFINSQTQILDIISSLTDDFKGDPQVTIGLAHHSLRAVTPDMLKQATAAMQAINPAAPIHIHVAEQTKEVDDCLAWSGKRPVEWLLENAAVGPHWCLIHATHMTDSETRDLAHTGAVAGLCPTTEANLGDGLFNLPSYVAYGGRFGIGSDSHISVSPVEELRLLEYGQRLLRRERAVIKASDQPSVGALLYKMAVSGGTQALGRQSGTIAPGQRADFIALDAQTPALLSKSHDIMLDAFIFAGNVNPVRHVVAGGQHVVKDFHHIAEEKIFRNYKNTLEKLGTGSKPGNETINSRLREAAARDDVAAVRELIAQGANPYDTDENGYTAFNRSASNGLNALAYLTEIAFDDTQKPKNQRRWKDYDLNTPSGYYGSTLITYAAKVCPAPVVKKMIDAGADITIVNGSGWTLLHCAAVMPGRQQVLADLTRAFREQGLEHLIHARSSHVYETSYNGNKVVYGAGLTATELCKARIKQDPGFPREMAQYAPM